ncbi:MAG: Ig-like domain-containing protein, partial [Gammaproteobacteria bacterium]
MVSAKITTSDGMQTISLDKDKTISLSPGEHLELAPDVIPLSLLKVGDQLIIVLENNIVIKVNNYFSFNNSAEESPLLTVLGETFVPADFETTLGLVSTVGVVNFELPALYADQHSESDLSLNTAKDLNPLSLAHRELSELYIEKLTNSPPDAVDDNYTVNEDGLLIETILANDSDPDGDAFGIIGFSQVTIPLSLDSLGNLILDLSIIPEYQSLAEGEIGVTHFEYTIADTHGLTDSAIVTVSVIGVNDEPIANADEAITDEDSGIVIDVLANDTDVDVGDSLSVVAIDSSDTVGTVSITNGGDDVSYNPTGFDYLAVGETAIDTFEYTIMDSEGATSSSTVSVTITGVNDAPVANADNDITDEDTLLMGNVLSNDSDVDVNDILTVIDSDGLSVNGATVVVDSNGNYSYDPSSASVLQSLAVGENLVDSFTYTISDGNGGTSSATVTVTVNGVNDGPIANDDTNSTDEDTAINGNVLSNDSDVDATDVLTVIASDNTSANGATVVVDSNGNYSYDPSSASVLQSLAVGENLVDSFTYTISDGNGGTSSATVTVTVNGLNDGPIANDDTNS